MESDSDGEVLLTFNEADHSYKWDGHAVPGVTTVIGEWVLTTIYKVDYYVNTFTGNSVPAALFKTGADHGSAVHLAIKYFLADELDLDALDKDILAAVNQFQLWQDEYIDEVYFVEKPMYSKNYRCAGTPDFGCRLKRKYGGSRALIDFKTGAHGLSGPQTAIYDDMWREESKYRGKSERYVLELPKSGDSYKFKAEKGKARDDLKFFLNKLAVYNYLKGK